MSKSTEFVACFGVADLVYFSFCFGFLRPGLLPLALPSPLFAQLRLAHLDLVLLMAHEHSPLMEGINPLKEKNQEERRGRGRSKKQRWGNLLRETCLGQSNMTADRLVAWAHTHVGRLEFFREKDLHPVVRTAVCADCMGLWNFRRP